MTRQHSLREPQLLKDPQVETRKINKRLQPRGPLRAGKTWMSGNVEGKAARKLIVHAQPSEIAFAAMQPNHRCAEATYEVFDAGTTHCHEFSLEGHLQRRLLYGACSNGPGSSSSLPISRIAGRTSPFMSCKHRIVSLCPMVPSLLQTPRIPGRNTSSPWRIFMRTVLGLPTTTRLLSTTASHPAESTPP